MATSNAALVFLAFGLLLLGIMGAAAVYMATHDKWAANYQICGVAIVVCGMFLGIGALAYHEYRSRETATPAPGSSAPDSSVGTPAKAGK